MQAQYKPNQLKASMPHKVPVRLTIRNAAGEKQVVEVDVFYRGLSLDALADFPMVDGKEGKERIDALKEQLVRIVISIPAFGVGPDFEQKADADFFGEMDDAHVDAINDAIGSDRDPNAKPSSSSQPTTGAEGE